MSVVIDIVKQVAAQEAREVIEDVRKRCKKNREWDIGKDDRIDFFDARLSYQLTGYRPINDQSGLDFDPAWFTEAADTYNRAGKYCSYVPGSKLYRDYWQQQYIKCRDGMTVNGYTITGDHYYFLNFYRLEDLTSAKKAGGGRDMSFPKFFVAQYEYFHYIELCKVLRCDAIGLKARGVGFSEIAACVVANTYNCRRGSMCVVAAQQENYLSKILSKIWVQLNFCNENTDGGFFKLRQKKDTETNKRASVLRRINGEEVETGWMSEINGITADKPNKIRGDRTDILLYEESGSWPQWKKAYLQGEALVGIQGAKFGIRMAWGTGGDSGPALEGLADAYSNPRVYDALPYRHCYTPSGNDVITGYFIPAYSILNREGYIDHRGWCDPKRAKEYYEKQRQLKINDKSAFLIYCAEYCFTADEALQMEGTNKFNKIQLSEQLAQIRLYHRCPKIDTGDFRFLFKKGTDHTSQNIDGVDWISSSDGLVHILEHPLWVSEGDEKYKQMRNLYVAGIDGIDIGQSQTSDFTRDPSDFCIVVKRRAFGMRDPLYVAYYKYRPDDERKAYETAIKLMMYYNCRCNIEATRLTMLNWAKDKGWSKFFMPRPRATYPDINRKYSTTYGTPATSAIINHQTDLIAQYVEDYSQDIWFEEMLEELIRYTNENKTKFDIVAAMGMCELADEELLDIVPTIIEDEVSQWRDIGFYIGDDGLKHWGVIPPRGEQERARVTWDVPLQGHSSDPRYMHTYE